MKKPLLASIATASAAIMLAACSPQAAEIAPTAESVSYDTANPPTASEAADENSDNTVTKDNEWSMNDAQDLTGSDITEAGVYRITGDAGDITVNAPEDAQVVLVLDNAKVGSITVNSADDVAIYVEGSNTSGAIYSEADLTISGDGSLTTTADEDGIVSKDDLVVLSGTLNVTAGDDGLKGTDSVTLKGGDITVNAQGDAVKSSKDDDQTKGWARIQDGTLHLTAGDDAISAATDVIVDGGTVDITSTDKGINAGTYILSDGGDVTINSEDDGLHSDGGLRLTGGTFTIDAVDDGVHAEVAAVLDGANLIVTNSEEALEGGLITISAGELTLTSSDDGINASGSTAAEAGAEAIAAAEASADSESADTDTDTTTHTGTEDQAQPGQMGQPGEGGMGAGMEGGMESTGEQLTITGGTVTVNAGGDGLDSNGNLTMSGGTVTVWGPTDGGNGALDTAGSLTVTGGTLLAVGSSGMAEAPSSTDGQGWISASTSGSAGDAVTITDASGNEVATFTATKDFGNVVYSAAGITNGESYTVSVNGTDTAVTAGEAAEGGIGGGPAGGMGQRPDDSTASSNGLPSQA
ncbi:carbohydrate-binding domain-containing protein [Corynebacterium phoceense]|uniref:carbohydrate-binding domain-containing protein n=1 Tax=Corynebacterium phoceense TaxID=1686286 RepID=UPI00211CABDF|nr:carbohydrate-binding domain-containing protein [Corynebacterium phoceense]MCQ9336094.1 carbohydrate-binding domain-containing protein [Corynebacterium phoceense]